MNDLLIAANLLSLVILGLVAYRRTESFLLLLMALVQSIYLVVAPWLYVHHGLSSGYLQWYPVRPDHVTTYLVCGLAFLWLYYPIVLVLASRPVRPVDEILGILDYDRVGRARLVMILIAFGFVSYVAQTFKFSDPLFFMNRGNSFAAQMALARGWWFVTVLGGFVVGPVTILLARAQTRLTPKSLLALLAAMTFYYVFLVPGGRTWALSMVLAWVAFHFGSVRLRYLPLYLGTGVGLVLLLVVLNGLRLGQKAPSGSGGINIAASAVDFLQFDNALILINHFESHEMYHFRYMAGAVTPLVLVPSKLFPWKPPADKEANLTSDIFGEVPATYYHPGSTITFSVPMSGYADAGPIGVVFATVIYALITAFYLKGMRTGDTVRRYLCLNGFIAVALGGYRLGPEGHLQSFWLDIFYYGLLYVMCYATIGGRSPIARSSNQTMPAPGALATTRSS